MPRRRKTLVAFVMSGAFMVASTGLGAAAMLDRSLPEAVDRFQRTLKRIGVDRALRKAGVVEGDMVSCGSLEFEWVDKLYKALPKHLRHKRTRIGVGKS